MSLRQQVMQGGMFMALRQGLGMVIGFFALVYVTRTIGPGAYGVYAAAFAIYQFVLLICQWGLNVHLIRQEGEADERQFHQVFWLMLALGLAGEAVALATMPLWRVMTDLPGSGWVAPAVLLALPVELAASVPLARLERNLAYKPVAIVEFCGGLVQQLGSVTAAVCHAGMWSPVIGLWLQGLVRLVGFMVASGYRPRWYWDGAMARAALSSGLAISCSGWIWQLRALVNPLIVGRYWGADAVGAIALAIRFVETLGFARYATWRLALAALAKVQSDKQRLARAIHQGMWLQMIAVGLPLAAFALVGPWFCEVMLGKSWELTFAIFPFLALATLVNAGMNLHVSALLALRESGRVIVCCVVLVGLFAGAALGLVPRWGVVGYGWAELAAFPGYLLVHVYAVRAVGPINYRPAAVWFLALALSLFVGRWHAWVYLGWLPLAARRATWLECRQLWNTVRPITSGTRRSTDPETPAAP